MSSLHEQRPNGSIPVTSRAGSAQPGTALPDSSGDVVLRLDHVSKAFAKPGAPAVCAVEDVNLEIRRGETYAIVGESGCGKTTLARIAAGLLAPTEGTVTVNGHDIADPSTRHLWRPKVQMVFQDPLGSLNPRRRVGSIIAEPLIANGARNDDDVKRRVRELAELVGLNPEHLNRFPVEFSGGQRQRIGLARALALEPELLICDEPVSALDVSIQAQVLNLLSSLRNDLGLTTLFISHNLAVVEHVADRVGVMYLGRLVEQGATEALFAAPSHPYTEALISAAPEPFNDTRERIVLLGDAPSPVRRPTGCSFHPRCSYATVECSTTRPALEPAAHSEARNLLVACHHPRTAATNEASDVASDVTTEVSTDASTDPSTDASTGAATDGSTDVAAKGANQVSGALAGSGSRIPSWPAFIAPASSTPVTFDGDEERVAGRTPWQLLWSRLRTDKAAILSVLTLVGLVVFAVAAPLIAHLTGHGPDVQFRDTGLSPDGIPVAPNGEFLLGTDQLGRDLLVRAAYGAQVSLFVGAVATASTVIIGTLIGLVAGYRGGKVDTVLSRFTDIMLGFPFLLTATALVAVFTPSLWITLSVIAAFSWTSIARLVRGQVLSIKEKEYVEAARCSGASDSRIMRRELLPNVLTPVIAYAALLVPQVIIAEATLSFLGIGIVPPRSSWGSMIDSAVSYYGIRPTFLLVPSLLLFATTLACNILGDSVRDVLDPQGSKGVQP